MFGDYGPAVLFAWIILGGLVGMLCGRARDRGGSGALLGVLLGPLGWLLVFTLDDLRPRCPECGGVVFPGKNRCCHCGSEFYRISPDAKPGTVEHYEGWKKSRGLKSD